MSDAENSQPMTRDELVRELTRFQELYSTAEQRRQAAEASAQSAVARVGELERDAMRYRHVKRIGMPVGYVGTSNGLDEAIDKAIAALKA